MTMTVTTERSATGFRLLSLDGGGLKGIFAAAILACLEDDLGISVVDHFDLVAGTSTGGIIALGLGSGLSPREIVEFYVSHGPAIFPPSRARAVRRLLRSKHRARPLRLALEDALGEKTLADSRIALAIPAYDLCNDDVHLFRTPHAPHLRRDGRELMVDVALATAAAPTYLPAHPLRGLRLVDGGMWANNPTLVGIVEAVSTFRRELGAISVFSLGTTLDTGTRADRLDRGGLLPWAGDAIDVVLRGQTITADNHARLLIGEDRLLRVDPRVEKGELSLDRLSTDRLLGRAERWSRHIAQQFKQRFVEDRDTSQTEDHMETTCSIPQPT